MCQMYRRRCILSLLAELFGLIQQGVLTVNDDQIRHELRTIADWVDAPGGQVKPNSCIATLAKILIIMMDRLDRLEEQSQGHSGPPGSGALPR